MPTAWRTLAGIVRGGGRAERRVTAASHAARRHARRKIISRHGALPGVAMADKTLNGVPCIRLDATVTIAHSGKELAEANFKGLGHHPLLAECDNTGGEPLAPDTAPRLGLIAHLDKLAARRGYELTCSVGWALGEREKTALRMVPEQAWQVARSGPARARRRRLKIQATWP